jgi:general secretion pathway protein J
MRRHRGFTLIELVIAMFIAAIMFALGYGTIRQAVASRDAIRDQEAQLLGLQTAMRVIEQDFVQLAPRPIRAPIGFSFLPALLANAGTQPVVALTRNGWTNPAGLQRPGLQRVAYFFENGTLRREYWTVLDPTQSNTTLKRDLISHLKSVSFRYMNLTHQWQDQWPPAGAQGTSPALTGQQGQQIFQQALELRPLAVEITLETEDYGKLVRIVEIAG